MDARHKAGPDGEFLLVVNHANEVVYPVDHAANLRRILQFGDAADLVELEANQRLPLHLLTADRAAGLHDLDRLCGLGHRHHSRTVNSIWDRPEPRIVALLRSAPALDALSAEGEYGRGVDVVRTVLTEPLYWIASNAGYDGQATIDQVKAMREGHGLDATTGEFGDLFEKGVVDPVRVTRLSLEHAASVAALMLTTEALVAEELIAQPGAIVAPGFGDLAEGLARPSSPI